MVDVGGCRWIWRLAFSSNSDVVGPVSLWCLGSLAGGLSSGVRPLHQNTPFLWQSSCSGCDAFDHPAVLAGYSYKLDRWTCADTTKQEVREMIYFHRSCASHHIANHDAHSAHLTPPPLSREGPERFCSGIQQSSRMTDTSPTFL